MNNNNDLFVSDSLWYQDHPIYNTIITACRIILSKWPASLADVVGRHAPQSRRWRGACESERFALSRLRYYASVYTGKEQSLLSTTREIGSSVQSETRARVRARIINPRIRTHTLALCICGVVHCQAEITETQIGRCDCDGRRREPRAAAVL
jgi:hypothetical protein